MVDSDYLVPKRRKLPKLIACMTKQSLENMRNKMLFSIDALDAKGIRRRKLPLYKCLILELKEAGYTESSNYLQDLLYDNMQLVEEDDIGIVVDLRKRDDYLEHICARLQIAEREREKENTKKECLALLNLALCYKEKGKGILWLAEKFFLATMAVSSRFLLDGGRLKGVCKYFYAKFLLDKFPGADTDEAYNILTEVRDNAIGKSWPLYEPERDGDKVPDDKLFGACAVQLHRVLLQKARCIRKCDTAKAERLCRLAERRGIDADDAPRIAEAIIEVGICQLMMNNLNNAKKTFHRAFKVNTQINNIEGLCVTRMHLAATMQRLGDHETAAQLLTEMGALAMEHNLRRQLGSALHLLGELHLRRERPELGTQHLTEAFVCFMGYSFNTGGTLNTAQENIGAISTLGTLYDNNRAEIYKEEAEQSRLMTAISAGQEIMASYFDLLRQSRTCTVSTVQCIEWKLLRFAWWVKRRRHELLPCLCPIHNRTALDVLWIQLEQRAATAREMSEGVSVLRHSDDWSVEDFQKLKSSITQVKVEDDEEGTDKKKEIQESSEQETEKEKEKQESSAQETEKEKENPEPVAQQTENEKGDENK